MPLLSIAFLIISCLAWVFAFSFLLAAVFTFAANDRKPLDPETDRMLSRSFWLSGGRFAFAFAVMHGWHQSPQGRRFFYTGLVSGAVAVASGYLAMRSG